MGRDEVVSRTGSRLPAGNSGGMREGGNTAAKTRSPMNVRRSDWSFFSGHLLVGGSSSKQPFAFSTVDAAPLTRIAS